MPSKVKSPGWNTLLFAAIALSILTALELILSHYTPAGHGVDRYERPIGQDFINVWCGPYFAFHGQLSKLFDVKQYTMGISQRFGHALQPYSWSYPPHTLLLYYPFSLPSYFTAIVLWTLTGLAAWLAVYRAYAGRLSIMPIVALCLSPAFMINVIDGQNGFFASSLFIGGLLLMRRRPVLAGVLFGVLTFKPQIGIILPFVLIALREWRVIKSAVITFCAMIAISMLFFGFYPWIGYFAVTSQWQLGAIINITNYSSYMSVSPLIGLRVLGASPETAIAIQLVLTVIVIAVTCQTVRRTDDLRERIFILCSAVPLISPYLLNYDLCLLTIPLTLAIFEEPRNRVRNLFLLAWLMPTLSLAVSYSWIRSTQALAPLLLFAVFVLLVARVHRRFNANDGNHAAVQVS